MKIDKKLIKELTEYLDEFNLTELEYSNKDTRVKVSKSSKISAPIQNIQTNKVKDENVSLKSYNPHICQARVWKSNDEYIDTEYIVCRAFKKLETVIQVSREIAKKSHKLIILKGQNAQEDLKKAFNKEKYDYKLENSITNEESKIIIVDFKK